MPLLKTWTEENGRWGIWQVTETLEELYACLSDDMVWEEIMAANEQLPETKQLENKQENTDGENNSSSENNTPSQEENQEKEEA